MTWYIWWEKARICLKLKNRVCTTSIWQYAWTKHHHVECNYCCMCTKWAWIWRGVSCVLSRCYVHAMKQHQYLIRIPNSGTGIKPNLVTVVSVLPTCVHLSSLQQGKHFHSYIINSGLGSYVSVENKLIYMYWKCKDIEGAHQRFYEMPYRDVVTWSVMIFGYAQSGLGCEALTLFFQMHLIYIRPNFATIVSVLPACAQLAALHQC